MLNLKRGFKRFFDNHSKALIISVCGVMIGVTGVSVAVVNSGNNLMGAKASQWTTFSQKETVNNNNVSISAASPTYAEPDSSVRLKEVNTTMDSVNVYSVKSSLKGIRRSLSRDGDEDNIARAVNNAIIAILNNSHILSSEDQAWIKEEKVKLSSGQTLSYDDYVKLSDLLDSLLVNMLSSQEYNSYISSLTEIPSIEELSDEDIISMSENNNLQIIDVENLDIGEEESVLEHENDEVVEEEGTSLELFENSALSYGVDVSHYQKEIDWAKVKSSGIDFAIIKCGGRSTGSNATLYEDSYFEDNIQGALVNGIQVGVYFFSQATSVKEAYEEASFCINLIEKYQITYPVAFDWESSEGYRVADAGISREQLTQIVQVFCDTIASQGYQPMVYFCRNDWYNAVDAETLIPAYKTWLALYYNEYYYKEKTWQLGNSVAEFDYKYDMWQYGASNSVPGIDGYVDMDIAFFAYSNYEVKGLAEPVLTVTNKDIQMNRYEKRSLLSGVYGTNSLGYSVDVKYQIKGYDGDLNKIPPGVYTVTYSFKDPRRGILQDEARLTVYDTARIEVKNSNVTIYEGDKYDFLKDITAYDSFGKRIIPDYIVTLDGNPVSSVKRAGSYIVTYNIKDERQGVVTRVVNLKVIEQPEKNTIK